MMTTEADPRTAGAPSRRLPRPRRSAPTTDAGRQSGISLLEVIIAAAIVSLLALAVMSMLQGSLQLWTAERAAARSDDAGTAIRRQLLKEIRAAGNVWIQTGGTPSVSDAVGLQLPLISPTSTPVLGATVHGVAYPGDWVLYRVEASELRRHHAGPSLAILDGAGQLAAQPIAPGGLQVTKDPATGVVTVQVTFAGGSPPLKVTLAAYPARDDNVPPAPGP